MSTASSLANITKLLTSGTSGSDVAGVVAANAKLDLITADLGITGTVPVTSAPVVTAISPLTVAVAGGTSGTLSGTGFTGATAVNFGTVSATSFTVVNDTTINFVSPPLAAGVSDVTIVTPIGTSALSTVDQVTAA